MSVSVVLCVCVRACVCESAFVCLCVCLYSVLRLCVRAGR